jgi:hypothetical protein
MDGVTDETKAPNVGDWTALSWYLGADQTSGISTKDLLLSNNVSGTNTYKFDSRKDGKQLEFKHVLSKITVNILAGEGFDGKFTNDPVVVLTSNEANSTANTEWAYTSGTFDVTTGALTLGDLNAVTMAQVATAATNYTVTKEALVMPGSTFASDAATIMRINADGNIYYITAEKIRTAIDATDHANGTAYPTKAGKNYIFKVRVNKTGVEVTATVKDWDTVDSEEETPAISFTADVTSSTNTTTGSSLSSGDTFRLWKTSAFTETALAAAKTTTVTYDGNSTYTYNPTLYWQSAKDDSYFRALATMTTTGSGTSATTTIAATESTTVNQGTDVLWGTTAAHTGTYSEGSKEYAESSVINPRTGVVPLILKHAMSNVVVELATSNDASAVDYSNATISISNLYTNGTINIADGEVKVSDGSKTSNVAVTVSGETIMVPQTIDTNAKLVINLNDNTDPDKSTTYSLILNTCKDSNGTVITKWAGGNKYTYTITLKKQEISFRAMVQDWTENKGSGNATLDWD